MRADARRVAVALAVTGGLLAFVGIGVWLLRPSDAPDVERRGPSGPTQAADAATLVPATSIEDATGSPDDIAAPAPALPTPERAPERVLALTEYGHDVELEAASKAVLTVTVFEGDSRYRLVNHPVRVEPFVFRPGRAALPEMRTDADGRIRIEVPAGEVLRVLVLEEYRNVTKLEERLPALAPGTEGALDVTVPLPPLDSMWVRVVDDATDEPAADARVWIERLLRIDGEPLSEVFVEARTDRDGRALLSWPRAPALGARAEKLGVGEARFVPVDGRGTETEPFVVRLGELPVRGADGR
ncbi:MAG: hypothetical protein WD226_14585 [Planctomycetota bacterium]